MATKADNERVADKASAIYKRLSDMNGNLWLLIKMLDEQKLDMLILALGLGDVELRK